MGRRTPHATRGRATKSRKTHEDFVAEVSLNEEVDITVIGKYVKSTQKLEVKCNRCMQQFSILPTQLLSYARCTKCPKEKKIIPRRPSNRVYKKSHSEYVEEVRSSLGDKYEVVGRYESYNSDIRIKHVACGNVYITRVRNTLLGSGCPKCKESKGERAISSILARHISFTQQFRFSDCRHKQQLPFDFAVFRKDGSLAFLVEYDGEQHFRAVDFFGGEETFQQTQLRDAIKTKYCADNNIPLIRIAYYDFDNIDEIMTKALRKYGVIGAELTAA